MWFKPYETLPGELVVIAEAHNKWQETYGSKKPIRKMVYALVDTGAQRSAISRELAREMRFPPIGPASVKVPCFEEIDDDGRRETEWYWLHLVIDKQNDEVDKIYTLYETGPIEKDLQVLGFRAFDFDNNMGGQAGLGLSDSVLASLKIEIILGMDFLRTLDFHYQPGNHDKATFSMALPAGHEESEHHG